jgi:hypothetical protein
MGPSLFSITAMDAVDCYPSHLRLVWLMDTVACKAKGADWILRRMPVCGPCPLRFECRFAMDCRGVLLLY